MDFFRNPHILRRTTQLYAKHRSFIHNEKWVSITDVLTDTHFILKSSSEPLRAPLLSVVLFCIQFFSRSFFPFLLFLQFDLIDLCMLPLFVLCSGSSVASSYEGFESWAYSS